MVGVDRPVAIRGGNLLPNRFKHRIGAVAEAKAYHLPRNAGNGKPHPERRRLTQTQRVYLNGVAFGRRQGSKRFVFKAGF